MPERGSTDAWIWKVLLIAGVLLLLYNSLSFVVVTLIALMIAAAILPLADSARKHRVPRVATVAGVYIVGLGGLSLLFTLLVPVVADQGQQLLQRLGGNGHGFPRAKVLLGRGSLKKGSAAPGRVGRARRGCGAAEATWGPPSSASGTAW